MNNTDFPKLPNVCWRELLLFKYTCKYSKKYKMFYGHGFIKQLYNLLCNCKRKCFVTNSNPYILILNKFIVGKTFFKLTLISFSWYINILLLIYITFFFTNLDVIKVICFVHYYIGGKYFIVLKEITSHYECLVKNITFL